MAALCVLVHFCDGGVPWRYGGPVCAVSTEHAAIASGVLLPDGVVGSVGGSFVADSDGFGGLVLLAALAVAGGRGIVVQHGAEQKQRVGCESTAVVLHLGAASCVAGDGVADPAWPQVRVLQCRI